MADNKCKYILSDGSQCKAWSLKDKNYCFSHDPENVESKHLAVVKGGSVKQIKVSEPLKEIQIKSPQDVITLLTATIAEIRQGELDPRVGTAIAYIASVLVKTFEVTQVNEKMEAMKEIIESRPRQRDVYGR